MPFGFAGATYQKAMTAPFHDMMHKENGGLCGSYDSQIYDRRVPPDRLEKHIQMDEEI